MTARNNATLQDNYRHDEPPAVSSSEPEEGRIAQAEIGGETKFIHPDAKAMFARCPVTQRIPLFGESCEGYGPKCTAALGLNYLFAKGIANSLLSQAMFPMFRNRFGIDATRYQRLAGISKLGFSIKAFTAMLTDTFAVFGYTKRWYCALSCVTGAVLAIVYALLPAKESSADIAAGLMFLVGYCIANIDILSQGHYSRLMRRVPIAGPALVSWIYWAIMLGGIIAAAIQGPVTDKQLPQVGLFVCAGALGLVVLFFIFNWYGERYNRIERAEDARIMHEELLKLRAAVQDDTAAEPLKNLHPEQSSDDAEAQQHLQEELASAHPNLLVGSVAYEDDFELPPPQTCLCGVFEINKEVATRNWRLIVYSCIMTACVIAMTCITIMGTRWQLLYTSAAVAVVCIGASFWALPFVISKVNVFIYCNMLLYLQLPGLIDSFYMATPACVPGGPHFSYTFYKTVGVIIGNFGGILGIAAFNYIFSKHTYRLTFIATTVVQILSSVFDIVMLKRWNVAIGIPDHAMYILGDSIVYEVCFYMAWMPVIIIISRVCPRGSESMVYALAAGFANMGQSMSNNVASILMESVLPIDSKSRPCDFSNGPLLLLIGHMLLPLLIIPLSFLLLPNARVCDDLDVDGRAVQKQAKKNAEVELAAQAEPLNDQAAARMCPHKSSTEKR